MDILFIINGILFAFFGTLLSGCIALLGKGDKAHSVSQIILALANLMGALATFAFLRSGLPQLTIIELPILFGASLSLDSLSAIFFLIVTSISFLTSLYAIPYLRRYREIYHLPSLNLLTALFIFGMQGVVLAGNVIGFMFAWEMMSIASFFLVMADREKTSIQAALLYFVMTHLGAGAILAGFFILTGGNIFIDLPSIGMWAQNLSSGSLVLAFILFLFGFGSKAGLVPFHAWLPEAHPQAPSHISALMSGVMLKMAVYGFLRVVFIFLPSFGTAFGITILSLGLLSAVFGVLYAVIDRDIKRTLAFSSIENIGLIFTFIGLGFLAFAQGSGLLGNILFVVAIFHSLIHAIFKSGLFLTAGVVVSEVHTRNLEAMGGLAKRMPFVSGIFCALALGAAALPPFGAFYSEWMGIQAIVGSLSGASILLQAASTVTLVAIAFVGGMAVFAMVKLFAIANLGEPRTTQAAHAKEVKGLMGFSLLASTVLFLLAGLFAPFLLKLIGAEPLTGLTGLFPSLLLPTSTTSSDSMIQPLLIFFLLMVCLFFVFLLRRVLSDRKQERLYHTWDCGQPIDASMEYTATAFSGPIRFFFRWLLRTKKTVVAVPVIETNPWIASRQLTLNLRSVWMDYLYEPIGRGCIWIASRVKYIQSGSIQFYLLLIFVALILTLIIAV